MLRGRWPVFSLFLNHADLRRWLTSLILTLWRVLWVKQGAALIIKMVLETGVLSLGPHICCFRPLALNHISKVRAGPCAAYTAETRQSGERGAGLESCLSRSGAVVAHAVLLFGGRMIDRRMGGRQLPFYLTLWQHHYLQGWWRTWRSPQYCRSLKHFRNAHLQPKMSLVLLHVNSCWEFKGEKKNRNLYDFYDYKIVFFSPQIRTGILWFRVMDVGPLGPRGYLYLLPVTPSGITGSLCCIQHSWS